MARSKPPPRPSPEEIHIFRNTSTNFNAWINLADGCAESLERLPADPDWSEAPYLAEHLREHARRFKRWTDPVLRPSSDERAPYISDYMTTRSKALAIMALAHKKALRRR